MNFMLNFRTMDDSDHHDNENRNKTWKDYLHEYAITLFLLDQLYCPKCASSKINNIIFTFWWINCVVFSTIYIYASYNTSRDLMTNIKEIITFNNKVAGNWFLFLQSIFILFLLVLKNNIWPYILDYKIKLQTKCRTCDKPKHLDDKFDNENRNNISGIGEVYLQSDKDKTNNLFTSYKSNQNTQDTLPSQVTGNINNVFNPNAVVRKYTPDQNGIVLENSKALPKQDNFQEKTITVSHTKDGDEEPATITNFTKIFRIMMLLTLIFIMFYGIIQFWQPLEKSIINPLI